MSCFSDDDDPLDVPSLWRALEELEEGTLDPSQGEDLTALTALSIWMVRPNSRWWPASTACMA